MNKLSTILCFLLSLVLVSGEPQEEVESSTQSEESLVQSNKSVKASKTDEPVYIDGNLILPSTYRICQIRNSLVLLIRDHRQ